MSVRTEWARAGSLQIEVTRDFEDAHGSTIDPCGVALLLGTDSVFAVEASDVDELLTLAARITAACEAFNRAQVAS